MSIDLYQNWIILMEVIVSIYEVVSKIILLVGWYIDLLCSYDNYFVSYLLEVRNVKFILFLDCDNMYVATQILRCILFTSYYQLLLNVV